MYRVGAVLIHPSGTLASDPSGARLYFGNDVMPIPVYMKNKPTVDVHVIGVGDGVRATF